MWDLLFHKRKGGRLRPPFFCRQAGAALLLGLLFAMVPARAQQRVFPFRQRVRAGLLLQRRAAPLNPKRLNRLNAAQAVQDPVAMELFLRMLHSRTAFSGEQATEVLGRLSRQRVIGDEKGRVRLDYLEPQDMAGDIMLMFPRLFRNYHKAKNTLEYAMWPTSNDPAALEKNVAAFIRRRQISLMKVGEETVAGRPAAIVQATGQSANGALRGQVKFWIDTETGLKLKQEISGPRGLISRTYFTSVTIGPAANISARDFNVTFPANVQPIPLFPEEARQFSALPEARAQASFPLLEPTTLPPGFQLSGVWLLPALDRKNPEKGAALLRYTDGVINFALYERLAGPRMTITPPRRAVRAARRFGTQRWVVAAPGGRLLEVFYIGNLSLDQVAALHDSLH